MEISEAVRSLDRDLQSLFGPRLRSLVVYREPGDGRRAASATLAVVDGLTAADLRRTADRTASWHEAGLETPLLLGVHEFARSLDVFPYEFGAILAEHAVVSGDSPFKGLRVDPADLRRACEIQARSHLLHLREGYLETLGRSDALADLIVRSAPAFVALIASVKRLSPDFANPPNAAEIERLASGVTLTSERARKLFPDYLAEVESVVHYVDGWSARAR
jgi:hypothetical protein